MATKLYGKSTNNSIKNITNNYEERIQMLNELAAQPMTMALGDDDLEISPVPAEGSSLDWPIKPSVKFNIKSDGVLESDPNQNLGICGDAGVKSIVIYSDQPLLNGKRTVVFEHQETKEVVEENSWGGLINIPAKVTNTAGVYDVSIIIAPEPNKVEPIPSYIFKTSKINLEVKDSPLNWSESIPVISYTSIEDSRKSDVLCMLTDDGKLSFKSSNILGYVGEYNVRNLVFPRNHWTSNVFSGWQPDIVWSNGGRVFRTHLTINDDLSMSTIIPAEVTTVEGDWQITFVCYSWAYNYQWKSTTITGKVIKP